MESSLRQTLAGAALAPAAWLPELAGLRTALGASIKDPAVRSLAAMWLVAAAVVSLDLTWARAEGLSIVGRAMLADAIRAGLGMAILFRAFQYFGERLDYELVTEVFRRAARFFHVVSLVGLLNVGFVVLSYLAVAAHRPAIDATLSRLDAMLGFDWLTWFNFVHHHFWLRFVSFYVYESTAFVTPAALIYLVLKNRDPQRYHEMLWVFIVSATATIAICALAPAVHALTYVAFKAHHAPPWHLYPFWTKFALYTGQISAINLSYLTGVVSFPSFHAALVVIFGYALRGTRLFRPALVLGAATMFTLPGVGGHYLVDIPAGALVAFVAIVLVRRWLPVLAVPQAAPALAVGARAQRATA